VTDFKGSRTNVDRVRDPRLCRRIQIERDPAAAARAVRETIQSAERAAKAAAA